MKTLLLNQFALFHSTKPTFEITFCRSPVTSQNKILCTSLGRESYGLNA